MTIKYKPRTSIRGDNRGSGHFSLTLVLVIISVFAVVGIFKNVSSHADSSVESIRSGIKGECLDDKDDILKPDAKLDLYGCNGSDAQGWQIKDASITHDNLCLAIKNQSVNVGSQAVLGNCDQNNPSEVWLVNDNGLYNPNSKLCLSSSSQQNGSSLVLADCGGLGKSQEVWQTNWTSVDCPSSTKGQKIACAAINEWVNWHRPNANHTSLLTSYTDNAPYEEWCADFVSYVYKEAGYPFTGGETNGWDENNANNILNMGFSMHSDLSSYSPQVGDVAYFNYEGGHVEIVISGGKTPTFLYGNSATIDPATGNGQMEANTIINDGNLGSLMYYLSPN